MVHSPMTVDLYVYASHEVTVWEHMWWALRRRGVDVQFVVEPPGVNRARGTASDQASGWHDDKDSGCYVDLMDDAMFERTVTLLSERGITWLTASRSDADVVVTTSGAGWIQHYRGKKVRTMYGVGAVTDSYGHGAVNNQMDAVLVHGPFSSHAIALACPRPTLHEVGFPKWAAAFRNGLDRGAARRELGLVDDGRPLVAWLPTWAQNSSIDRYSGALAELAREYRIVAKPHHNNLRFEQQRVDGIDPNIEVLEGLASLVPLVVASDIVVGDVRSGGVTEALLADRAVVGLVPSGDIAEQNLLAGLDRAIAFCESGSDLRDALERSIEPSRQSARAQWSRWFFGEPADDDERAATAIISIGVERRGDLRLHIGTDDLEHHLAERAAGRATLDAAQLLLLAWPTWPGDPRLLELLEDVSMTASAMTALACAQEVRLHDMVELCPVRAMSLAEDLAIETRLSAAALGSVHFGDDECTTTFMRICSGLQQADLEPCLIALLTVEPSVVSAFVTAADQAGHRDALADLLRSAGADEGELAALLPAA